MIHLYFGNGDANGTLLLTDNNNNNDEFDVRLRRVRRIVKALRERGRERMDKDKDEDERSEWNKWEKWIDSDGLRPKKKRRTINLCDNNFRLISHSAHICGRGHFWSRSVYILYNIIQNELMYVLVMIIYWYIEFRSTHLVPEFRAHHDTFT